MKLPKLLLAFIIAFIALGIAGLAIEFFCAFLKHTEVWRFLEKQVGYEILESISGYPILQSIGSLALIFTLVAVIYYAHYTHRLAISNQRLAEAEWTPCANSKLEQGDDPYLIYLVIRSYSKMSLRVKCWINPWSVAGELNTDFYDEPMVFETQPLGEVREPIDIRRLLSETMLREFEHYADCIFHGADDKLSGGMKPDVTDLLRFKVVISYGSSREEAGFRLYEKGYCQEFCVNSL